LLFGLSGEGLLAHLLLFPLLDSIAGSRDIVFVLAIDLQGLKLTHQYLDKLVNYNAIAVSIIHSLANQEQTRTILA